MHEQLYVTISALLTMFFIAAILMVPNTSLAADRPNNNDLQKKSDTLKQEGTFFVSDAGRSHGGFEFNAEYRTNFNVKNGK
jgi:hypothetical protein